MMELGNPTYESFDTGDEKSIEGVDQYTYASSVRRTSNVYDTVTRDSVASTQDLDDKDSSINGGE